MTLPSHTESPLPEERKGRRRPALRAGLVLCVATLIALTLRLTPLRASAEQIEETVRSFGPWGPIALGVIYVVLTLLLVPGFLLTLVAGAIYGFALGAVIASAASTTSVALAFLLSRFVLRERVRDWIARSPRLTAIDAALARDGWRLVALLRLSPLVPFAPQNYVYGVTSLRMGTCVAVSWMAMLPATLTYAYIGSVGAEAVAESNVAAWVWVLRGAGVLATIGGTVYLSRTAQRALRARGDLMSESDRPEVESR